MVVGAAWQRLRIGFQLTIRDPSRRRPHNPFTKQKGRSADRGAPQVERYLFLVRIFTSTDACRAVWPESST